MDKAQGDRANPAAQDVAAVELTIVSPTFNERPNVRPLVRKLHDALRGVNWEVIFVDDNSPDGTTDEIKALAAEDPRVRGIRRVGRRGLAGAVLEGALASAAPYVAVIDADLQHDEGILPQMLQTLRGGDRDLVIASRYLAPEGLAHGLSATRERGSRLATWLSRLVLKTDISDPVSGFFMARREVWDRAAPKLSREGFKILFDIVASHPTPLRVAEIPYEFRDRQAGESKLDSRVVVDYLGLILNKASHDLVPTRFLLFGAVGASGIVVQLVGLAMLRGAAPAMDFATAQLIAALIAMTSNYFINNVVTYHDRRKRGWNLLTGYLAFCLACSAGLFVNVAVASFLHDRLPITLLAGAAGAAFGAVWNYVTTALAVW
ncbi:MAG TPA: glycosyltransferase family 2 protein [Caulobacteraceae bacterium]|nr:glycosyltransferase family 2 protein [Caulobacteraceae bacterium]